MSSDDVTEGREGAVAARGATRAAASPNRVLAIASLGAVLAFVDATIVNIAFPDIVADFPGTDIAAVSWVLNAYNIVFAAFLVAAGRFADLLGRKRLFETGIVLFTAASVLCALAPSLETLIAARILQALGAAIVVPASLALVIQAFPGRRRGHGVAIWSAIAALSAGLGPSLGGLMVELDGWRLVFLVNAPVGLVAWRLTRTTLVESRAPGRRTIPDLPGAAVLAAAIALLTLGLVKGHDWGWTSVPVLGSWALAALLGAGFARRCTWHAAPMLDLDLLRIRSIATTNALTVIGAAGYYAMVLCNVLFLTSVWGYSVLDAGLAMTPGPFIAAVASVPAAKLADRYGAAVVLAVGATIWALGIVMLVTTVGGEPAFLRDWLPCSVVLAVGAGATFPVVGAAAVAEVPGGRFATATGLNSIARQFGAVLGVALLIAIVGVPGPRDDLAAAFDRGWSFAGVCFVLCAVGALTIGPIRAPEDDADAPSTATVPRPATAQPPPVPVPVIARAREAQRGDAASARRDRDVAELLAGVGIFASLDGQALQALTSLVRRHHLRAGEWLFEEGDIGDALYIVAAGSVEALKDGMGVAILSRGEVLGELALLTGQPRSASVRARRDAELLMLTRGAFERVLDDHPEVARALLAALGEQVQRSRVTVQERRTPAAGAVTYAVLSSSRHDVARSLASALCAELGAGGRVGLVEGPCADTRDDAGLLERLERENDHVVLVADPADGGAWRDFVVRHADRIVLVADTTRHPRAALEPRLHGCDLVVCGPVAPGRVRAWEQATAPRARHLIPDGHGADEAIARCARRLSGRAVGLLLSGGGARALAHIGVFEALADAGIVVDRIGGTSFGAFVGALLADGRPLAEIDAIFFDEWVRRRPVSDYTVPRVALTRGERARAMAERVLPGAIEDLPIDFFCTSADLLTGALVVHREGPLAHAVRASAAVPGLIPPVAADGHLLVDGGVVNNLPIDEMLRLGEGPIIAVDVSARLEVPAMASNGNGNGTAGSWRSSRWLMGPGPHRGDPLPGIGETLTSGLLLGSVRALEESRAKADLLIRPDPVGVGRFEFHQMDLAVEAGRAAAVAALQERPDWATARAVV